MSTAPCVFFTMCVLLLVACVTDCVVVLQCAIIGVLSYEAVMLFIQGRAVTKCGDQAVCEELNRKINVCCSIDSTSSCCYVCDGRLISSGVGSII